MGSSSLMSLVIKPSKESVTFISSLSEQSLNELPLSAQPESMRKTQPSSEAALVIHNGDFYYKVKDSETKLIKETPYKLLEDDQKKKLGKNNEAKLTLYNFLPRKEYERVFMCKTAKEVWHTLIIIHQGNLQVKNCNIDILTQEYEKFSIFSEETIDSGFTRFIAIVTSLKSLDLDCSSKNHVRNFLHDLPLKWRAKVMTIEEAKDLATLPLDELVAKVTREQTSEDIDSQGGSDEGIDEQEAEAFNSLARNLRKFFRKGNWFGCENQFSNGGNWFGKGRGNRFEDKGGESSKKKGACNNYEIEGHFAIKCRKPKENKAFMCGAWSNSKNGDEHQNDATCLMAIDSQEVVSKPTSPNIDIMRNS
ncbi:hypothetical protein Tco_0578664 [Tanacetum coccineum]